jgi:hypothetical protein
LLLLMVLSSGSFHTCSTGNRRGVGHNSLDPKPQHMRAQSVPVLPQLHVLQLLQSLYFCHILVMKPLQLRADRQQTDVTVQPQHAGWWVARWAGVKAEAAAEETSRRLQAGAGSDRLSRGSSRGGIRHTVWVAAAARLQPHKQQQQQQNKQSHSRCAINPAGHAGSNQQHYSRRGDAPPFLHACARPGCRV